MHRHAKGVNVRAAVDLGNVCAFALLRRSVALRAEAGDVRDAEVDHAHGVVRPNHDILSLQVTVHQRHPIIAELRVHITERIGDLLCPFKHQLLRLWPLAHDALLQCLALNVVHHDVHCLLILQNVRHADDRRMLQLAQHARLVTDAFGIVDPVLTRGLVDDLDRPVFIQAASRGQVNAVGHLAGVTNALREDDVSV